MYTYMYILLSRYELPQPGAAQKNDVTAWQESVDNSMAQLEHQAGRFVSFYVFVYIRTLCLYIVHLCLALSIIFVHVHVHVCIRAP